MTRKKICLIAQFPPPIHGLSKASSTIYNSELNEEFDFEKIDITDNKKLFSNLLKIYLSRADLFYFTISQSKLGNLRDLLIFMAIGNRPCLVHLHGGYYRTLIEKCSYLQRIVNYNVIRKLKGAIVLGERLKWIFKGILAEEKIYTIPNCVEDDYICSVDSLRNKISSLKQRKIKHVLYLSNFIRTKGFPKVLEMALCEKNRGGERLFHFDFAGKFFNKSEEKFFWNFVNNNDLTDYVTYHGIVEGDKKKELFSFCDVFCLLTTYPKEGQPISIIEAMGNGMVIITTDHAGILDLVHNEDNGIVVSKENIDSKSIYESLIGLTKYKEIETLNYLIAKHSFCQSRFIENLRNCFLSVMKDKEKK